MKRTVGKGIQDTAKQAETALEVSGGLAVMETGSSIWVFSRKQAPRKNVITLLCELEMDLTYRYI